MNTSDECENDRKWLKGADEQADGRQLRQSSWGRELGEFHFVTINGSKIQIRHIWSTKVTYNSQTRVILLWNVPPRNSIKTEKTMETSHQRVSLQPRLWNNQHVVLTAGAAQPWPPSRTVKPHDTQTQTLDTMHHQNVNNYLQGDVFQAANIPAVATSSTLSSLLYKLQWGTKCCQAQTSLLYLLLMDRGRWLPEVMEVTVLTVRLEEHWLGASTDLAGSCVLTYLLTQAAFNHLWCWGVLKWI